MAITSRKLRFRAPIIGGGFDSSGNPRNGKTLVVTVLGGTAASAGITCNPEDLGLTTIDFVHFMVTTPAVDANGAHYAAWVSNTLYVYDEEDDEIDAAFVAVALAVGDSAEKVELL